MITVIVDKPAGTLAALLGALRGKPRGPARVEALPEVTYVRPQVVLDAVHVARYSSICGFSKEHGVPIIYLQMLSFPLVMALLGSVDWPWPALGTVHLANRIAQHRKINPGDAVRVEVSSGSLFAHEKGQVFTLEMRILRADELVWEATQTLLRIGVGNPAGPAFASALATPPALSHQADFSAPGGIGRRYGRVSGDMNPIHLSALSARLFGFKRAIAHGMWTKARALAAVMPGEPVSQAVATVEFKTPLFLPARVSLWTSREMRGRVMQTAAFEVRNAAGDKPHLRGQLNYPEAQA